MALQDYYNSSPAYNDWKIDAANDITAMIFEASSSYSFKSIRIKVFRVGNPGNITMTVQGAVVSGLGYKPNGSDLLTPNTFDGDSITTDTDGEWITITFTDTATIVSGTRYSILMSGASTGGSDYIEWVSDDGNQSYAENIATSTNGGSTYDISKNWGLMFEANDELPGKPTNPSPSDTASDITLDESPLSWDASINAVADTYEIYFREQGEDWDLIGVAQAGVEFVLDFGILDYEKTYEWKVDATNTDGTTTGDTWTFGSIVFDPPSAGTGGGGGGTGEESSPTGENNMITLRRLVVAVENKIWYEDI